MKHLPIESMIPTEESIGQWREMVQAEAEQMEEREKETFQKCLSLTSIEYDNLKMNDGAEIEIVIIKPKALTSTCSPAYIYAHGGGAISFTARMVQSALTVTAVNLNCVCISIDYRKGPEHKCPRGQQDYVDALL